jgi:L-lactate utilization protein LutC
MSFFKKLFSSSKKETDKLNKPEIKNDLPLDESFVNFFKEKSGKFLYCSHQEEVNQNLVNILKENSWEESLCLDNDLQKLLTIADVNSTTQQKVNIPFFTTCEHLIAKDGSIMFSSNQLSEKKLTNLPIHFIVFAKTSQIVYDKGDALMSIKNKNKKNIPSNISAIKCYDPNKKTNDFMDYGNNNSKNLYLLLLEDL